MSIPASILSFLNEPYTLTPEQIDFYNRNRYIKLKNVLNKETITYFNDIIGKKVSELSKDIPELDKRNTYGKAFLQLMNLWKQDEIIRQFVFSKRIAQIATELMQTTGVRMYHDQALFKEPGGGFTPWHADQYYWPLETDKTITAWMPLQSTPLEMGPLEFCAGSHHVVEGRELGISDESEAAIQQRLRVTDFPHVIEPFEEGEISFHSGWLFHRAGANTTAETRKVMTVIYMDKDMKLKAPENDNQQLDWEVWCPGAAIGEIIDTPMSPVMYAHNTR